MSSIEVLPILNHVAMLVEDLTEGIKRYSEILGVRFRPPNIARFAAVEENGVSAPADLLMTYSMEGPVYVELMQAMGTGVWSSAHGFGLHHIGGYVSDLPQHMRRVELAGLKPEASVYTPGGELLLSYLRPEGLMGTRYELLSEKLKPGWTRWVAGGPPPGHD
jgi:catechol 2,3-dioxygenase-like lactoylglutathione lyase family enzyme